MFKKIKNKAIVFSVIALYALVLFSFVTSPTTYSKAIPTIQNHLNSTETAGKHETIQQQSDVQYLNNEFAEIEESEEDDKDEKAFEFDFAPNSTYSLFSLVHQRFKNKTSYSKADEISAVPTFILLCTYRI